MALGLAIGRIGAIVGIGGERSGRRPKAKGLASRARASVCVGGGGQARAARRG
jgi:hypothetical protein